MSINYKAVVITVSDKGFAGEREDLSGKSLEKQLKEAGFIVDYRTIVPDESEMIQKELKKAVDEEDIPLVITTGGTGFSPRDITPEAAKAVYEREAPGIGEAMRAASMKITNRGMLSRANAGLRKGSLIITLPGSEKASKECLEAVIDPIKHGIDILRKNDAECGVPMINKAK